MSKRAVRVGVLGVVVAIGGMVACGGSSTGKEITIASSANPANVVIDLRDDSGTHIGSCSGILITSSTVLTAGHCVVKATQFVVSTVGGKQTANGALTYTTWQDFESSWSHPQHSDIGVIVLDQAIFLAQYPTLATALLTDGTRLSRVRRVDPDVIDATAQFEEVSAPIVLGQEKGFPLAYGVDPSLAEVETDTGGALYDPASNTVYGVVSGKGMSTGRFYVSRVDYLADWVSQIGQCEPAPRTEQCHPSGSSSGSGSGSGSSGSSSSGSGSSSSSSGSNSSSGGSSSSSGCNGSSGSSSSGSGSSSSGSGGSNGSSGGSGSTGSSGGSGSSGSSSGGGGGCNPPSPPQPPPTMNLDSGCGSSGSGSGGSGSGSGGSTSGSTGSSSGSSGSSSGGTVPLVPDGPGCSNAFCGGCKDDPACEDNQQDYGGCGCTPTPPPSREAGPNN
jgi:hypothetical protein